MKSTIEQFYQSFTELDAEGMAACYHDDVIFEDPAFGVLEGERVRNMWRMLCGSQKGKDFVVRFSDIHAQGDTGSASWEALYTFSSTGRHVHNIVQAQFKLKDGKIIDHRDHFNLYRWSRQAMGLTGYLIGWTPFFKKKLHAQTNGLLDKFEEQ